MRLHAIWGSIRRQEIASCTLTGVHTAEGAKAIKMSGVLPLICAQDNLSVSGPAVELAAI